MITKRYFSGFSIFNKNKFDATVTPKFEGTIGQAISAVFNVYFPTTNIAIYSREVIEKVTEIPDSIIQRMKAVDAEMLSKNISSFYYGRSMHRRLKRNPFSSYEGYTMAIRVQPEEAHQFSTPLAVVREFFDAKNIRKIIKNNNLDIRVTNTCGLVFWCKSVKDLATVKILAKGCIFGEVADISDIGRIEEDLKKLVEE